MSKCLITFGSLRARFQFNCRSFETHLCLKQTILSIVCFQLVETQTKLDSNAVFAQLFTTFFPLDLSFIALITIQVYGRAQDSQSDS